MNCVGTNFALNPVPTEVDLVFNQKPHVNQSLLFGFSNRGHNADSVVPNRNDFSNEKNAGVLLFVSTVSRITRYLSEDV